MIGVFAFRLFAFFCAIATCVGVVVERLGGKLPLTHAQMAELFAAAFVLTLADFLLHDAWTKKP